MSDFKDDDLDGIFGGPPAPPAAVLVEPTARPITLSADLQRAAELGGFFEACRKCGGSGRFGRFGRCFACDGKGGKTFKTSGAERASARQARVASKARTEEESWQAFAAAHPPVAAWIVEASPTFEFAAEMGAAVRRWGDLTERQLAACERSIAKRAAVTAERQARVEAAPSVDVSRIERAFDAARAKADRPGALGVWVKPLKLQAGDVTLAVRPGSPGSQWEGMLFVASGDQKLGFVKDGKFRRRFACSDAQEAAVLQACSDPEQAAIAFGKAWSRCAVCSRELTNDGSIERGIGPICAQRFGW